MAGKRVYDLNGEHFSTEDSHQLWGKTILGSNAHLVNGKVDRVDFVFGNKFMDMKTMAETFKEWKTLISEKTDVEAKALRAVKFTDLSKTGYSWDLGKGKYITLTAELEKVKRDGRKVEQLKGMTVSLMSKDAAVKFVNAYHQAPRREEVEVAVAADNAVSKGLKNLKIFKEGKHVKTELAKAGVEYYALYYSASW